MNTVISSNTGRRPVWLFGEMNSRHSAWSITAGVFAALTVAFMVLSNVDERTFQGVSVWVKPFKFALSLGVFFATLAWFAPLMPQGFFQSRAGRVMTASPVLWAAFEMIYIAWQGGQAQASHYNTSAPIYEVLYSLMGVGAVWLVGVGLWMGVVILRRHGMHRPYPFAVGLGLVLTFVLGGGLGGYMSSQPNHWVGQVASDANGMPFFNWVRDGGDLRVAHFFGMHVMQILPLVAAPLAARPGPLTFAVIVAAATAYSAFTLVTFFQAVGGQPFLG